MRDANDATAVGSVFLVWKRVVEQAHTLPYLNQPCRARWDEQDCLQVGIRGHDLHAHVVRVRQLSDVDLNQRNSTRNRCTHQIALPAFDLSDTLLER